ncbi:MAG: hypothetical protein ACFFBV_16060 [Promethearchaeota archaeon]
MSHDELRKFLANATRRLEAWITGEWRDTKTLRAETGRSPSMGKFITFREIVTRYDASENASDLSVENG